MTTAYTSYEIMEAYFRNVTPATIRAGNQGNGFTSTPGSGGSTSTPTHIDNSYFLHTLSLTPKSGVPISIINSLVAVEIFEDIFSKSIHGTVEIKDIAGMLSAAYITGGEFLELTVMKPIPSTEIIISRKDFVIYQISKVESDGQNSMSYKLNFMPASAIEAQKKRLYKSFKTTRSILDVVTSIYKEVSGALKLYTKTDNLPVMQKSFVSPGYTPYEAIDSLTKRACYNGDYFLFFERLNILKNGNHVFSSINNLRTYWSTESTAPVILYQPKMSYITPADAGALLATSFEIQENFDHMNNMKAGFYNSKLRMLDVLTRKFYDLNLNYSQIQDEAKAGKFIENGNIFLAYNHAYPETPGERLLTRSYNDVFANKTTWVRTDVFGSILLSNMRVNVTMPGGNNLVGAGTMVDLKLPSAFAKAMNLGSSVTPSDNVYAGKYMVTAVLHTLTPSSYTKKVELSRDSGKINLNYTLNQLNNTATVSPQYTDTTKVVSPPPVPPTRPPSAPAPVSPAPAPTGSTNQTSIGGVPLPSDWATYTGPGGAAKKIAWFNANNIGPQDLLNAGVTQAEIDWMQRPENGYTAKGKTSGTGSNVVSVPSIVKIAGVALPSDWATYTGPAGAAKKIAWFNTNNIGPQDLLDAGVTQAEIDWMLKNGYTATGKRTIPSPAPRATAQSATNTTSTAAKPSLQSRLPADWATYTGPAGTAKKIAWFNQYNISAQELLDNGVTQAEIDWMLKNGYRSTTTRAR